MAAPISSQDGSFLLTLEEIGRLVSQSGNPAETTDLHDRRDSKSLYSTLRQQVIPLFYQRDRDGLPRQWIARMKRAIRTLGWRFSAHRMVKDYVKHMYIPAAGGTSCHLAN